MIEPALTAEEWAKGRALRHGFMVLESNGGLTVDDYFPDDDGKRAVAAFALKGAITWEMVDALRDARSVCLQVGDMTQIGTADQLKAAADLLKSLLPPRP